MINGPAQKQSIVVFKEALVAILILTLCHVILSIYIVSSTETISIFTREKIS